MYSSELFWKKKRAMEILQGYVVDLVKSKYGVDILARGVTERTTPQPKETFNFCALRFTALKASTLFPIGMGKLTQMDAFLNFLASGGKAAADPDEMVKELEKDFVKVLHACVESELEDQQIKIEPNSMLCIPQKSLYGWANVAVENSMVMTFQGGGTVFEFVLPTFDKKFYEQKTADFFGFPVAARILVVDDSATSRKLSRHALALAGYTNIDETPDGESSYNKLSTSSPPFALVVADWHMPVMSGLDLLKKIRQDRELKSTPVILATGEQNAQEVTVAIKEGVSGYVVKPFQPETLYKAMKKASGVVAQKKAA